MSRIGMLPVAVPGNVTVSVDNGDVTVKGPKGELKTKIGSALTVSQEDGQLSISRPDNHRENRSQHGLARTLISNMIQGVTNGHQKELEIHGVGYRAQLEGKSLVLNVGYSHPIKINPPANVEFEIKQEDKSRITNIVVRGVDKAMVGQVAADVRKSRKPDPYKGKGVRYKGEVVKLRPGKRAGK